LPIALRRGRKSGESVDAFCEMGNRLGRRRTLRRALSGPKPIAGRLLDRSGLDAVLRHDFRLHRRHFRELIFQAGGNTRVKLLALSAQQAAVGCVPDERMLE
jgi:hypothetical protein